MNSFFLEFVTRDRCPLCREGEVVTRRVAALLRCPVRIVDVESDDELVGDYGLRIPVVRDPAGRVLDEGNVEFGSLLRRGLASRLQWLVGGKPEA